MTPGRGRYAGCCGGGVNAKQITALIRTARSRINLASEVISDSRRRVAVFHGHTKATPGTRVAAIRAGKETIYGRRSYRARLRGSGPHQH